MKTIFRASLVFLILFLAVTAIAKSKRYDVQLAQPVQAGNEQLKAGAYQVEMEDHFLVFYQGKKEVAKVPVRSEELQTKNDNTSITISQGKLIALQLSGTKTKLVVEDSQ